MFVRCKGTESSGERRQLSLGVSVLLSRPPLKIRDERPEIRQSLLVATFALTEGNILK